MGGVAPTFGFFSKFYFIVGAWSGTSAVVFAALAFLIIFSSVFYFQVFKNFFFLSSTRGNFLRSAGSPSSLQGAVGLLFSFLGASLILFGFFFFFYLFFWSHPRFLKSFCFRLTAQGQQLPEGQTSFYPLKSDENKPAVKRCYSAGVLY